MSTTAGGLPAPKTRSRLRWPWIWAAATLAVLYFGYRAPLTIYITPQRGVGYWLGIVGGSMMLLLLVYSARKRFRWLRWMGGIPAWFQAHMTLGIVGPILVLFHANFSWGATNSNVALICMLLVAGSGVVGRYFYTRLHANLEGHEDTLEQLKMAGSRITAHATSLRFMPGLLETLEQVERRWIEPPRNPLWRAPHLLCGAVRVAIARWVIGREIARAQDYARRRGGPVLAAHSTRLGKVANAYARRRLDAGRRITEYQVYSKLFSLWHVLHIPLFFMLLIAGIVHVLAINIY